MFQATYLQNKCDNSKQTFIQTVKQTSMMALKLHSLVGTGFYFYFLSVGQAASCDDVMWLLMSD